MVKKIDKWIKKNKLEFYSLIFIIIFGVASFLYFQSEFVDFVRNNKKDALVAHQIFDKHEFPLVGPYFEKTPLRLGPFYYYLMSVRIGLYWLSPALYIAYYILLSTI